MKKFISVLCITICVFYAICCVITAIMLRRKGDTFTNYIKNCFLYGYNYCDYEEES